MNIDALLTAISFGLSLGGFVSLLFWRNEGRKAVILTVTIAALVVSTGIAFYSRQKAERLVTTIQGEISEQLVSGPLTFDEIYIKLHFRPFPVVTEAIFRSVEQGTIKQRQIELFKDGAAVPAKTYYLATK